MKRLFKLNLHKKDDKYGDVEFLFNPKELPDLIRGDIVQISSATTAQNNKDAVFRILLQVTKLKEDCALKNSVSIDSSIAASGVFPFKPFIDVYVKKVQAIDVSLDLLELTFREQYISRSDMCRIRRFLLDRCVYLNGKIEFCLIRMNVNELWRKGERVTCGYVDERTRVVIRSSSALVFVFIQMSTEMWDYDTQGSCYYEKCVDGFLPELFKRWNEKKCAHYVTVAVFSRWFFSVKSLDEFPFNTRFKIQKDYRGRFYQDFYHVLVQNEHYEDWMQTIPKLKSSFHRYNQSIRDHLSVKGMPPAENSTAADGNVIETLNLSFNVFATHYVDRTFERTGQMVIVITPGAGVFNVDRGFANMTKQRNFDFGIGVDLVCLGEQPLHAVPLLIYHSKATSKGKPPEIEDYFIMHWVNYSYYNPLLYPHPMCDYRPRVKLPDSMLKDVEAPIFNPPNFGAVPSPMITYPDFDAYDNGLFSTLTTKKRQHKSSVPYISRVSRPLPRQSSEEDFVSRRSAENFSLPIEIPNVLAERNVVGSAFQVRNFYSPPVSAEKEERFCVGSAETQVCGRKNISNTVEPEDIRRPLINPFKPSEFSVRITSNRRRWIHVFPVDSRGLSKQAHHSVAGTSIIYANLEEPDPTQVPEAPLVAIDADNNFIEIVASRQKSPEKLFAVKDVGPSGTTTKGKTLIWAWGCTGEEQWNPDIEVGADWKSMILPACLPITTDFFPDARSLKNDYLFNEYTILLDEAKDLWKTLATVDYRLDIFNELVAQRLQQGFQIVLLPVELLQSAIDVGCGPTLIPEKVCYMSISRIYHRISLVGACIYVTKFLPRHSYPVKSFTCLYECRVPDSEIYEHTTTKFDHDSLEKLNWSVIDNLIVFQGEVDDYMFRKDMKYWEARFILLPCAHPATQKIIAGADRCDLYTETEASDFKYAKILDCFLKFMELLNKIRRTTNLVRVVQNVDKNTDLSDHDVNKIANALTSSERGLNFFSIPSSKSSDKYFISAELVHWLIGYVPEIDAVSSAVLFAQNLLNEGKIRRYNCNFKDDEQKFIYGFYLYALINTSGKANSSPALTDCVMYEAAVRETYCSPETSANFCPYRHNTYKIDFDTFKRSERVEWGHLMISKAFCLDSVMELNIRWLVATGSVVNELIMQLHKKALLLPLCLLPIPSDPFALPQDPFSDPLRSPVSIQLDEKVINRLLSAGGAYRPSEALTKFCSVVLKRFGFLPLACLVHHSTKQYVHMSGGMCVMFDEKIAGFLWGWNSTLGHRYRSMNTTGDEAFQDKMLADFRNFCFNANDRLEQCLNNWLASEQIS